MSSNQMNADLRAASKEAERFPWKHRPANVRPAYQNTSDAMDIAVKALQLAASNAKLEGAPPALVEKLTSQAARLSAQRLEVMRGNPA